MSESRGHGEVASAADAPEPAATALYGRRLMPAGRVLVVLLVSLLTWTLLYAPTLKRAAEASPIGTRRTLSLAILTPIAAVSDWIGLDQLAATIERAVGHDAGKSDGAFVPPPDDIPVAPPDDPGDPDDGAGDGGGLGYFAERVFRSRLVTVSGQGRISTGLARPDYFNWPFTMRRIVSRFDPDLVIVMLGENDHQSLQDVHGNREALIGTAEWPPAYRDRVLAMMRIATSRGAKVVWAGLPISADYRLREHSRRQNDLIEFAASISSDVVYFDSWNRFRDPAGGYTAYYREGNRVILIREGDGLHFNAVGYTLVAREIARLAAEEFGLSPRTFETEI